jgi:FG-GAP repeat/FG-GAP-like repeat
MAVNTVTPPHTMLRSLRRFSPAALAITLTSMAAGQTPMYVFDGDSGGDFMGASVAAAGDVNGDGVPDFIMGAPSDSPGGVKTGSARVTSGFDGATLYTFYGAADGDRFGLSVGGAGDVNGDGFDDLIVGSPGSDAAGLDAGRAQVYSGLDGSVLFTFDGAAAGDALGTAVSGAGDVNNDGIADLVVGANGSAPAGAQSGQVQVFSGLDGAILHTFDGLAAGDLFGTAVAAAGDIDNDGFDDIVVGALLSDAGGQDSGSVRVFSGADGATLYTFVGDAPGDQFGNSVGCAGNVDGDIYPDLLVGIRSADSNGVNSGAARVFAGVDGSVLYTFVGDGPGLTLGRAVSGAGDVNGDGRDDLLVGQTHSVGGNNTKGSVRVFSGLDGSDIWTLEWSTPLDSFGRSVACAGDVNLDGYADFIVGDSHDDANGPNGGSAIVFSGRNLLGTNYCGPAVNNSTGSPAVIEAFGSDTIGDGLFLLAARDLPQGQFGYFFTSQTQGFVQGPGTSQGNLCLGGQLGRYVQQIQSSGPAGTFVVQLDLSVLPPPINGSVGPGETWNFQSWYRDNNPGPTSNFTDAVSVTFN